MKREARIPLVNKICRHNDKRFQYLILFAAACHIDKMATHSSAPPDIETPRFSTIDWKGRTSALLSSLEDSSRSLGSSSKAGEVTKNVAEGTHKLVDSVITATGKTKKSGHILRLRAGITVRERDIRALKQGFGQELFAIMDRNRNMGDRSGGEAEPELVEVFSNCITNVAALLELRKRKQTELTQIIKPEAICYQSTGDETAEELEQAKSEDDETKEKAAGSIFQRALTRGVDSCRNFFEKNQMKGTLKTEIAELDKDLIARKEQFGVDMYETMEYLGDEYDARDPAIKSLFEATKKAIDVPLLKILTAEKELEDVRATGSVLVSREELKEYIEQNPALWAMLEAIAGVGEEQCKMICFRVITELISGLHGKDARDSIIRQRRFLRFERLYVKNAKGSQEFFHRCVFASFDSDHNGVLDATETDKFLDAFYSTGSVVVGDVILPEKKDLKKLIHERLDNNDDVEFTFAELQSIINKIVPEDNQ